MGRFNSYTDRWAADRYLEVRPEDFTYDAARGETARAVEADPTRLQHAGTVDSPSDPMAQSVANEWHGLDTDGFPDDYWDSPDPGFGQDEVLVSREGGVDFQDRHVSNGAPAHRLRAFTAETPTDERFRSALEYDPEARLLADPTGADAERLLRGGHGAFNAYASTNSYARKPMEFFIREDRDMHDPAGLDSFYDIRPLFYRRADLPTDVPATPSEGNWGFVYGAWDSFTPEYLAQGPYDRHIPVPPVLDDSASSTSAAEDWGW